ncbi:MAG TPA: GTPase domain-containing protein, partial [Pseudonocardiaceae bacterium]
MTTPVGLDQAVRAILAEAQEVYRGSARASHWLHHQQARLAGPLTVAVLGAPKSGKSTLVSAYVGEEVAPVELADGAQVTTWYQDGPQPRAVLYGPGGPWEAPAARRDRRLDVDLRPWPAERVDHIVIDWPGRNLREVTLIDTPGLPEPDRDATAVALERIVGVADCLLYLVRDTQAGELPALRAALARPVPTAGAASTLLVLSRADEIGAGRIDALSSAKQIVRRYRRDEGVRAACQDVIAVAGLLAEAGRTLRDTEFAAFTALATVPRASLEGFLLSADRFTSPRFPVALDVDTRRSLLHRFGMFGLRLGVTLVRQSCHEPVKLAAELVQRSGLAELRESIDEYFVGRREVLKARSALIALDGLLRAEPMPAARRLFAELERVLASAHDFRELRLLSALRVGQVALPDELATEARRLIGGVGTSLPDRLGVDYQTSPTELQQRAFDALHRWQRETMNPMLSRTARRGAET